MTNEDVVRTWFTRFWENQDMSAIEDMIHDDITASGMAHAGSITKAELRGFAQMLFTHITNLKTTYHRFVDQGDWIAFHFSMDATNSKTGAPVTLSGQTMVQIVDGKIKMGVNHIDYISLFQQLGLLPDQTLENCFAGKAHKAA